MPHLTETCPGAELGKRYAEMSVDTSWVSFKISSRQLNKLKEAVMKTVAPTDVRLSSQDVLTAYIIHTLNRHSEVPITTVTNAASYRHVPNAVHSPDVAGNAVYIITTTLESASSSLSDVAIAIRRTILRCRELAFVEEYMGVASALMLSAVNSGHSWVFASSPEKLSVNSNANINWRSAHFGFPSSVRFHTSGLNDRYVRVFRSNPVPLENMNFNPNTNATDESWDVHFAVARSLGDEITRTIESDLQAYNFPQNIGIT
ncbi:hypothetical protein OH77DRAFT_1515943 [Trametes cingulata]|nr:hypothetical protein OH77DRAFT_1515943 [Trametes cingulata]